MLQHPACDRGYPHVACAGHFAEFPEALQNLYEIYFFHSGYDRRSDHRSYLGSALLQSGSCYRAAARNQMDVAEPSDDGENGFAGGGFRTDLAGGCAAYRDFYCRTSADTGGTVRIRQNRRGDGFSAVPLHNDAVSAAYGYG